MIYNMLTLSIQLLLIGFLVGTVGYFGFVRGRSQYFVIELALSILGSFLGTLLEVLIRGAWVLPMIFHLFLQFLIPAVAAFVCVALYRVANSFRD